jgi:hypothetical protein
MEPVDQPVAALAAAGRIAAVCDGGNAVGACPLIENASKVYWRGTQSARYTIDLNSSLEFDAQHRRAAPGALLASTTVTAVILTMRRTVAAGVRMCAGAAQPSRMGPMATLWPAADLSKL